jgi:hypothetical protein
MREGWKVIIGVVQVGAVKISSSSFFNMLLATGGGSGT